MVFTGNVIVGSCILYAALRLQSCNLPTDTFHAFELCTSHSRRKGISRAALRSGDYCGMWTLLGARRILCLTHGSTSCLQVMHRLFPAKRRITSSRASSSVSIRQHPLVSVSIHRHSIPQHPVSVSIRQHPSASVSMRQAAVSIRQHKSAFVSIRQHPLASVSIHRYPSAL